MQCNTIVQHLQTYSSNALLAFTLISMWAHQRLPPHTQTQASQKRDKLKLIIYFNDSLVVVTLHVPRKHSVYLLPNSPRACQMGAITCHSRFHKEKKVWIFAVKFMKYQVTITISSVYRVTLHSWTSSPTFAPTSTLTYAGDSYLYAAKWWGRKYIFLRLNSNTGSYFLDQLHRFPSNNHQNLKHITFIFI